MKRRTLLSRLDELRALGVDIASFGFVNLLQARHRLPDDFRARWDAFSGEWANRPVEQFYEIPSGFVPPELPDHGRLTFASPYPGEHPENNTAAFDFFPCAQGWTAPTMLLAHGLMSVSDFGYRLWARRLNARGWNAVFVHLPYHYSRRLPWHFHGELSVGGELLRSAAGVRQSVVECRIVLQQLAKKGGKLFGAWGTSYGGWIMALLGCFEPLLQRLILVEPILHIDNAIWRAPSSVTVRAALRKVGLTPEDTAGSMRLVCPAWQRPVMEGRHVLMLAGQYDKIAPPEEIEELARLWRGSHFACFPQGHVGYTLMPESFRMAQEIWASDFSAGQIVLRSGAGKVVRLERSTAVGNLDRMNMIDRTGGRLRQIVSLPIPLIPFILSKFPRRSGPDPSARIDICPLGLMIESCRSSPRHDWFPARLTKASFATRPSACATS